MSVQRFVGKSSRLVLKEVRATLGDDAVILSNRTAGNGVEVLAIGAGDMDSLVDSAPIRVRSGAQAVREQADSVPPEPKPAPESFVSYLKRATGVSSKHAQPASPTKFGQVARAAAEYESIFSAQMDDPQTMPSEADWGVPVERSSVSRAPSAVQQSTSRRNAPEQPTATRTVEPALRAEPVRAKEARVLERDTVDAAFELEQGSFESEQKVLSELRSMRGMLRDQLSQMAWSDSTRRDPVRGKQFARLISAGFSAVLARALLEKMPNGMDEAVANEWVQQAMLQNLRVVAAPESMIDKGGVYALVGPTGVGKTTTVAKLAARAAAKYGVRSIGMITVDHYRIGAHEQLRNYGKMMGCPVHLAHDAETLAELIHGMRGKHLILIDTIGAAQRDPKLNDQLSVLMGPGIERVLVVNAVSQIESLEEVVSTWRGPRCNRAVITKIDEAVKLGGAVDVCIRHKLSLDSVANGQRVPEDLHAANAGLMIHRALKQSVSPIFSVRDEELKSLMLHTATHAMAGGRRA